MKRRFPHIIQGNKRCHYPRECVFVDTETIQEKIDDNAVKHILVYGYAEYRDYDHSNRKDSLEFTDAVTFWEWVVGKVAKKRTLFIFAHNQDFDFRVLEGFSNLKSLGFHLGSLICDGQRWIVTFSTDPPKTLQKQDPERYIKDPQPRRITTLDTLNYFKSSLANLGKTLGLEKLTMPADFTDREKLSEYCKRDVEILRLSVEKYFQFIVDNDLGNFGSTMAKQSLNAYRHRFMSYPIHIHTIKNVIDLERESYYGGRTECFYVGTLHKDTYYKLDINSMYPYVMRQFNYPTKHVFHRYLFRQDVHEKHKNTLTFIAKVSVNTNKPCIPYRYNNRLCFPVGSFTTTLCKPEIELLDKENIHYEIREIAYYEEAPIFRDYVDYFYSLRQQFKREGNKQYEYFVKLFMNSLYGKFGQRSPEWELCAGKQGNESFYERIMDIETGKEYAIKCIDGTVFELTGWKEGWDTFVAVSSFVTSYARRLLWEMIHTAGMENVYYCDTDSLFTNKTGYENLDPFLSETELGKLKMEDTTENLIIRNLKDYVFGEETKIKGIRKRSKQIDDNTFEAEQWEHLDGSLHYNRLETVVTKSVTKHLKREYQKGIITDTGRVIPFFF